MAISAKGSRTRMLAFALLGAVACGARSVAPAGSSSVSPRKAVSAVALEREPHLAWNAFVDLVASTNYEQLHPRQRPAHLAFWYNAEVQNGGHYQYFENSAGRRTAETIVALN